MSLFPSDSQKKIIYRFREYNNSLLPKYYHWTLHTLINFSLIVSSIVISFLLILRSHEMNLSTFFNLSIYFIIWAVVEYFIHRFILHGPLAQKTHLHEQHSKFHHSYFLDTSMTFEKFIDLNRVFLFTKDLVGVLAGGVLISFFVDLLIPHHGLQCFLALGVYLLTYETVHFLTHSPRTPSWPLTKKLMEHHKWHHIPENQHQYNFSIVLPILDKLFGTDWKNDG